jgi:RHS repeat-associated protein
MSTRQLTDATQQITDTYTYDAFGLLLDRSGATENNYLYTGEQYDPNVGFYYLRARYYNASIGRFLTMDYFPGLMFEPLSLHRYLYAGSNPVS